VHADDTANSLYKKHKGIGGDGYGYDEKQLTDNSWRVRGWTPGRTPGELTRYIALYRASDLAIAANRRFIKIINSRFKEVQDNPINQNTLYQYYTVIVEFSDDEGDSSRCTPYAAGSTCFSLDAARTKEALRSDLKIPVYN